MSERPLPLPPATPAVEAQHSRFVQRVRRRYAAELTLLPPGVPDRAALNALFALLQARGGRLEQARQALDAALRNDPTHRTARANLGQVHLMLAVQAWELVAAEGAPDDALMRRLVAVRALLLAAPEAPRRAPR